MTTQPTRDQLRALANAASPGPWVANHGAKDDPQPRADAKFIAAARNALPQILDQLDEAEARIKRLENRAASETARADAWRERHRVMAGKRDAAHRAYQAEREAQREAEARIEAWEKQYAHDLDQANAHIDAAEARLQAIQDLVDQANEAGDWTVTCYRLQRAIDGETV